MLANQISLAKIGVDMATAEQPLAGYNGKPQIEDGYTKIANELLEAIIKFKFTERQYKVFFAILRKTYGFNKTNDEISLSQISAICNLPINHVSTVIKQLVELNIILKKQGKYAHNLMINKGYDSWGLHNMECHKVELHIVDDTVTSLGVLPLHNMEVQKTTPKENQKTIAAKVKTSAVSLQNYLDKCKLENKKALPDDCMVFKTANKLNIRDEWLHTCWLKFKESYLDNKKRQADWIRTFNNCVVGNWYGIWYRDSDGNTEITSKGRLLMEYFDKG
jgi:phage replication O-like protein O